MTPITISPEGRASVMLDIQEVHAKRVDLLKFMDQSGTEVSVGAAAAALTFGQLMSGSKMSPEDELGFIQAIFEWAGAYFTEGGSN